MRWILLATVLLLLLVSRSLLAQELDAPAHGRPFFLPPQERDRLRGLIAKEEWAKADYARLQTAAGSGNGYVAAFLHALDGDAKYVAPATKFLLAKYGKESSFVQHANKCLADPAYFKGGPKDEARLYYDVDVSGPIAFDWAYQGLEAADRKTIEEGMLTWARYKMRAMDTWVQTPNLVFKPTWTVAMTGLATQDKTCLEWGFHRTKPWGRRLGGYFEVQGVMLKDGGPWEEAPIYPIAHEDLRCMAVLSGYRRLYDGRDWFAHEVPGGGSVRGLMDYYLDTAYPIERTGHGPGQVRVATYGDGSTNARGDLFLANPAGEDGGELKVDDALSAAYNAAADPRYAAFLALMPDYEPNLLDRRPLPAKPEFPPAPSKVWPTYGLAMLRSDESPAYWTSGKALAVCEILSQGYGHDHRDKFSITLHGANRLLYPDYNAVQYENLSVGWTRNSPPHNTLIVDERDTRDAPPTGIRHEFSPEVKFLATSATGVFESVDQTRGLLLTRQYLLDLFQASSPVPHTYDYLLHSFGKAAPAQPERFTPSEALRKRYWLVDGQQALTTDDAWSLDFVLKEERGAHKGKYGPEWYDHTAHVRVTMAAEPKTLVTHGVWGSELAKLTAEHASGAKMDRLSMLAVRRAGLRDTVFAAVHEPYANEDKPHVRGVTTLAQGSGALVVRVDGDDFTDYAAVAFGPEKDTPEHALSDGKAGFAFRSYGYLRVARDGVVTARGGWTGFRLPGVKGPLTLNGKPAAAEQAAGALAFRRVPEIETPARAAVECPVPTSITPAVVRVFDRDRKQVTITINNVLKEPLSGHFEFDLPPGVKVEEARTDLGPVRPGESGSIRLTLLIDRAAPGRLTVPYHFVYRPVGTTEDIRTAGLPLVLAIGPVLESVYEHPGPPVFVLHSPGFTAKLRMSDGLCRYLAADDDTVRLDGSPLFTFADDKGDLLCEETKQGTTWPAEVPAQLQVATGRGQGELCRWQVLPFGGRMLIRMDKLHARFDRAQFTIPGKWRSPAGPPHWGPIVAVGPDGKEADARPGDKVKIRAAVLEFPDDKGDLAFQFKPPQEATFTDTGMKFSLSGVDGDGWEVGFCKRGGLDAWRGKK